MTDHSHLRTLQSTVFSLAMLALPLVALAAPEQQPARTDAFGDPLPPGAIARIGTTRLRHEGAIAALAWSHDGSLLASGSHDHTVCFWDPKTGQLLRRFEHNAAVFAVALSKDGKRLASGGDDRIVRIWDAASGKLLWKSDAHKAPVLCLAFSPDDSLLASGGRDAQTRLWDAASGKELRQFFELADTTPPITVVESRFNHVELQGAVYGVAFSPDGKTLAIGGNNQLVRLWDLKTGKKTRELATKPASTILGVAFSPDGSTLASACSKEAGAHLWDTTNGKVLVKLEDERHLATGVAFSRDGKTLVLCPEYGSRIVRLSDAKTGRITRLLDGGTHAIFAVAMSPDGKTLATGGHDQVIRLRDVETDTELLPALGEAAVLNDIALSADGKLLAATSRSGHLSLYDPATGKVAQEFPRHFNSFMFLHLNPDGKRLLLCDTQYDLFVVDLSSSKKLQLTKTSIQHMAHAAFSRDGRFVAFDERHSEICVRDLVQGTELWRYIEPTGLRFVRSLALSPDGALLAVPWEYEGPSRTIELWDRASGKVLRKLGGFKHTPSMGLTFSPDGHSLAAGNYHGDVCVWETATGSMRWRLRGKQNFVASVAFSQDGRTLATGSGEWWASYDGSEIPHRYKVRPWGKCSTCLWDLATGKEVHFFDAHQHQVARLAFTVDGRKLATFGWEGTALVWAVPPPAKLAAEPMTDKLLDLLWACLAVDDGKAAHAAQWKLIAAPPTVGFFKKHLQPVPAADPTVVAQFRKALESDKYAVRQKATLDLKNMGTAAEPVLSLLLDGKPTLEMRKRIEPLLDAIDGPLLSPERLRIARALEVLERIGSDEARLLLQTLAKGAPGTWLTRQAQGCLQRLGTLHHKGVQK